MHARELVELAAIVSAHGPVLIRGAAPLSSSGINQYWTASKCRLDRWARSLKSLGESAGREKGSGISPRAVPPLSSRVGSESVPFSSPTRGVAARGVLEEIFTGEILTRAWAAVLSAYDRHHADDQGSPVGRSILVGHLEARHRALTLLVGGRAINAEEAVRLNHLRRRCERWSDMLLGYLSGLHDISEFAVEPQRARDFAEDLHYRTQRPGGQNAWRLVLASLRSAFQKGLSPVSPNAELNAQIAQGILCCFQPELFDSTGILRSLWLWRLYNVTHDAAGMIEELLALDKVGDVKAPPLPPHTRRRF